MDNGCKRCKADKACRMCGCGAKVGAGELAKLLSDIRYKDPTYWLALIRPDDAAVYKVTDDIALRWETIDFFPPIADDPYASVPLPSKCASTCMPWAENPLRLTLWRCLKIAL